MAKDKEAGRVDLEDLTAAAMAGVATAFAAPEGRSKGPFHFPFWVGFIAYPDWDGLPSPFPTQLEEEQPIQF